MSTSLSSLVDNLSEIYNNACQGCKERKKIKSATLFNLKIINYFTNATNVKKIVKTNKWIN